MFLGSIPVQGKLVITSDCGYGGALMLNQFTPFLAMVTLLGTMQITVYNIFLPVCDIMNI